MNSFQRHPQVPFTLGREPWGEGEERFYTEFRSGPTSDHIAGRPADSPSAPVMSATNEPRAREKATHQRRRPTDKERIDNARRMRQRRQLINVEKQRAKNFILRYCGHEPPNDEVQLWRAMVDYGECMAATIANWKGSATQIITTNEPSWDALGSLAGPSRMLYMPVEEPISSYRELNSVDLPGPSDFVAMGNNVGVQVQQR